MTKKDYVVLANRLKELKADIYSSEPLAFDRFVSRLSSDLLNDNPNFQSETFRKAIYK